MENCLAELEVGYYSTRNAHAALCATRSATRCVRTEMKSAVPRARDRGLLASRPAERTALYACASLLHYKHVAAHTNVPTLLRDSSTCSHANNYCYSGTLL